MQKATWTVGHPIYGWLGTNKLHLSLLSSKLAFAPEVLQVLYTELEPLQPQLLLEHPKNLIYYLDDSSDNFPKLC